MAAKLDINSSEKSTEAVSPSKPEGAGEALEIVLEHAGSMGAYQRWLFLAMLPFGFSMAFVNYITIFSVATPANHWCHVPELEHLDLELRRNLSAPNFEQWDRCSTFDTNWTLVLETTEPPHPDTPTTDTCHDGWVFEFEDVPYETVASQREWVCSKGSYVPTVQFVFFAGAFVGGLLFGWVADRFGRVPAIVATNLVGFIGTLACVFTSSMWDFAICRFIVGMAYDNCFMLVYILILEYVGAKHRTWVANLSIMLYFGGGAVVLPWLALWVANWKTLMIVTAVPLAFGLVVPFLFPESARWLTSRGKNEEAVKMLQRLGRINKRKIPQEALDNFIALSKSGQAIDGDETLGAVISSHPDLRLLLILLVVLYATCGLVFDVLVRLSGSLGMDLFLAFSLSSATEFPSLLVVIFVLDKSGRRAMTAGSMVIVSVLSFVSAFVEKGTALAVLSISARFFMNMSFNTIIQWIAELLPSGARAGGASLVHVTAFLLASASPYVVYAERIWSGLPFVIIGGVALITAVISAVLPETKGQVMPHNCADAERLIKHHSLLGKFTRSPEVGKN